MNIMNEQSQIELQRQLYTEVALSIGISESSVARIHEHYLIRRKSDTTTRTQDIIYEAIAAIRQEDQSFPYKLSRAYVVSTALAKA